MDPRTILVALRESLESIAHPRWFETELGYQGQLLGGLHCRLTRPESVVIEQEYPKTRDPHGLRRYPDIIIHEPYDRAQHASRRFGNYAVIELKLRGTPEKAREDFASMTEMVIALDYPLAVFINIDSDQTHIEHAPDPLRGRLVCFAVRRDPDTGRVFVLDQHA